MFFSRGSFLVLLISYTFGFLFLANYSDAEALQVKKASNDKFSGDSSHEDIHSKNRSLTNISSTTNSTSKLAIPSPEVPEVHKTVKKVLINTNKTYHLTSTTENGSLPKNKEVFMEGGSILKSEIDKHKTVNDNNTVSTNVSGIYNSKTTSENSNSAGKNVSNKVPLKTNDNNATHKSIVTNFTQRTISSLPTSPKLKKIDPNLPIRSSPPPNKTKKKPLFSSIPNGEDINESDSFIESSTTGRDYVLPIVLFILALPLVGYIVKLIYRRGTEFTERQQYHRMYLIDGMYNTR